MGEFSQDPRFDRGLPNTGADIWTKEDCKPARGKTALWSLWRYLSPYLIPNVTCCTANLVSYLTFRNETFRQALVKTSAWLSRREIAPPKLTLVKSMLVSKTCRRKYELREAFKKKNGQTWEKFPTSLTPPCQLGNP